MLNYLHKAQGDIQVLYSASRSCKKKEATMDNNHADLK